MGRRRTSILLFVVSAIALSLVLLPGCGSANFPEILRGVTAGGGWWGACPRREDEQNHPLALSPELNDRLVGRFPPGSSEGDLINALTSQGFKRAGSCEAERSIKYLGYDEKGTGLPSVTAEVYWRVDSTGRIVWTKGFIRYTYF